MPTTVVSTDNAQMEDYPFAIQVAEGSEVVVPINGTLLRGLVWSLARDEGVCTASDLRVTQRASSADLSMDVSAGAAVIVSDTGDQSSYVVRSLGVVNVSGIAAPGGTGVTRMHRLVAEILDSEPDYGWQLRLIENTTNDNTTGTSEPDNAITLAFISMTSGQTTITNAQIRNASRLSSLAPKPVFRGVRTTPIVAQPHNSDKDLIATVEEGGNDFPQGSVVYVRRIEHPGLYRLRAEAEWSRSAGSDSIIAIQTKIQTCAYDGTSRTTISRRGVDSSKITLGTTGGADNAVEYRDVYSEVIKRFAGGEYVTAVTYYDDNGNSMNLNGGCLEIEYLRQ